MASLHSFPVATSPRLTYINGRTKVPIDSFITQKFVSCSPLKLAPPSVLKCKRGHGIKILAASAASQMEASIKAKISENPLVIYSKTRCSYCRDVKALFKRIGVDPLVVELNELGLRIGTPIAEKTHSAYLFNAIETVVQEKVHKIATVKLNCFPYELCTPQIWTFTTTDTKCIAEINGAIDCSQYFHRWEAYWWL